METQDKKIHWWFVSATLSVAVILVSALALSSYSTDTVMADQTVHQRSVQVAVRPAADGSGRVAGVEVVEAKVTIARSGGTTVSVDMNLAPNSTVFDALKQAATAYGLTLDTKDYGDLGVLVNGIGDLIGGQDGNYWSYYVNGTLATVAVNKQIVQPGDQIEFKFEASSF